jgi:predicted Ser/Thr protein kinase
MPDLQIGSVFAGYRIEAVAARGGMGMVYRATQLKPQRTVALKVIAPGLAQDPEYRQRFERESEIALAIEHPNVIPIYDAGEHDGVLYIAMRWVEGTTLATLIAEQGRLHPVRATEIIDQVAAALDAAHGRGLVHRDIKPSNVLIDQHGSREHVYLTDFGVARRMDAQTITSGVGTIDYMAPEQFTGEQIDGRADVYGLGCLLYRAITGEVPYPEDNDLAKMRAQVEAPPPRPTAVASDLAPAFDTVVARAMAKEPDRRYPTAGDMAAAARGAAGGVAPDTAETRLAAPGAGVAAAATSPAAAPAPARRRRNVLLIGAGGLVAVATGAALATGWLGLGDDGGRGGGGPGPALTTPHGARPADTGDKTTATPPPSTSPTTSTTTEPAACTATDDSGRTWNITVNTPKTTNCSEASTVWISYQRQLEKNKFAFQSVGDWRCRPSHCFRGVAPNYASFDAKEAR